MEPAIWEHFFSEARALVVPGEQGMTPQADLTPGRFWQSIIAHFRDRLQSCFDRRYRRANCSNHWENIGDWCEASRTTLSEPCISIWQVWDCMFLRIRLESILELCLKGFKTPILISTDEERLVTYFHPEKTKLSHVKMLKILSEALTISLYKDAAAGYPHELFDLPCQRCCPCYHEMDTSSKALLYLHDKQHKCSELFKQKETK